MHKIIKCNHEVSNKETTQMLDSASLVADKEGGEPTGESICVATVETVDSVVVVAVSPASEPSCVS